MWIHLWVATELLYRLQLEVTWMRCGTCASCLWIEVSTHLQMTTMPFDPLLNRVTWMWFGTCATCLWIEVWTHTLLLGALAELTCCAYHSGFSSRH